jgi:basic amino acid/polyamine antiporter, APA family
VTPQPQRTIPLLHATALVVANMIGTGIFTMTGLLSGQLGDPYWILGVWLVGGLLAMCGADVYGELGAMMPRAGGEYIYLSRAFHPAAGFLSGWVSLIVGFSAPVAASAIAFGSYVHAAIPAVPRTLAAVVLITLITVLHMASVRWGSRIQTAFTVMKVGLLLTLVVGGLAFGRGSFEHLAAGTGSQQPGQLAVALVFVSFAYSGWNGAAYIAGELKDPGKNLPRALLGGTSIVVFLYLALNLVFFYAAPPKALSAGVEVGDIAARALFGPTVGSIVSLLIALALVSSVSAMIMAGPRVYMAMAEDGLFFRAFARRGAGGAPWASVVLQGAIALVLALTATFEQLLVYIGFTLSLFAALTVLAAFVLRRREPDAERPYRARGWPVTPILFLGLSLWMAVFSIKSRPVESLAGLATLAIGLGLYVARKRVDSRQSTVDS